MMIRSDLFSVHSGHPEQILDLDFIEQVFKISSETRQVRAIFCCHKAFS